MALLTEVLVVSGVAMMGTIAVAVVLGGLLVSVIFTHVVGNRSLAQAREAMEEEQPDKLPEQWSQRPC